MLEILIRKYLKKIIECVRNEIVAVFEGFLNHFGPAAALKAIQDELPGDAIIIADIGSHSDDTMQKALIKALSVNEPVIINAVIDPEDYQWLIVRR